MNAVRETYDKAIQERDEFINIIIAERDEARADVLALLRLYSWGSNPIINGVCKDCGACVEFDQRHSKDCESVVGRIATKYGETSNE